MILSAIYPWKVGLAKELVNESVKYGKVSLPVLKRMEYSYDHPSTITDTFDVELEGS